MFSTNNKTFMWIPMSHSYEVFTKSSIKDAHLEIFPVIFHITVTKLTLRRKQLKPVPAVPVLERVDSKPITTKMPNFKPIRCMTKTIRDLAHVIFPSFPLLQILLSRANLWLHAFDFPAFKNCMHIWVRVLIGLSDWMSPYWTLIYWVCSVLWVSKRHSKLALI